MEDSFSTPQIPRVTPMNPVQRALVDLLGAARRPDGYCAIMLDFSTTEAWRAARAAQTKVPITLFDICLLAAARSFGRDPMATTLVQDYKFHTFDRVDIGVSLTSETTFAPTIVLRNADQLSLESVHFERVRLSHIARAQQEKWQGDLSRKIRFLPNGLRRVVLSGFARKPKNRAHFGGVIQFSTIDLSLMEWMLPAHMGGAILVSLGGIKERALVVEGKVEPRLCALATIMIDQRIVNPVRGTKSLARWKRLVENPAKLGLENSVAP